MLFIALGENCCRKATLALEYNGTHSDPRSLFDCKGIAVVAAFGFKAREPSRQYQFCASCSVSTLLRIVPKY